MKLRKILLKKLLSHVRDYGLVDKIRAMWKSPQREKEIWDIAWRRVIIDANDGPSWVCFLPWGVNFQEARSLDILPRDKNLIVYEGPIGLANPDPQTTRKLLEELVEDFRSLEVSNFNILSLSIGTYPGFYIANHFLAKKLVAVVPGSKLGACIYDGIGTKMVRKRSVSLWFSDPHSYDFVLTGTNPIENLKNLPDDIEIHLASHDLLIPTKYGEELVFELQRAGKSPTVFRYNGKWHILSLIDFWINDGYWSW